MTLSNNISDFTSLRIKQLENELKQKQAAWRELYRSVSRLRCAGLMDTSRLLFVRQKLWLSKKCRKPAKGCLV